MKHAAYYARVSTSAQEEQGTIESQIFELKQQIVRDGNVLVQEYIDNGWSGGRLDRPAMDRLREDIKTTSFDVVYFHNTDRIARDSAYQNIIIAELLKHGKEIIIAGKNYIDNPENKFNLTVLGAVSELEKAKIVERCMRGRKAKARQGAIVDSGGLFGYNHIRRTETENGRYEINQDQAMWVKYVYETYAYTDASINSLIKLLEKEDVKTASGKNYWKSSVVRRILTNTTYYGAHYFNRTERYESKKTAARRYAKSIKTSTRLKDKSEWILVPVPPIITQDLFEIVQNKLTRNGKLKRNPENKYFLSCLIKCGVCNHTYAGTNWKGVPYYKCNYRDKLYNHNNVDQLTSCDNQGIKCAAIDDAVTNTIISGILRPTVIKNYIDVLKSKSKIHGQRLKKDAEDINRQIILVLEKKKKILDLYTEGNLDKIGYIEKIKELSDKNNSLIQQKATIQQTIEGISKRQEIKADVSYFCKLAKKRLAKLSESEKALFVRNLIDEIIINKNKTENKIVIKGLIPTKAANKGEVLLPAYYTPHNRGGVVRATKRPNSH